MLQIPYEDVETYLADRSARGFNALWVYPVDAVGQANAPKNFYGNVPFDGPDFTNEDPAYWAYVDRVVRQADTYGITLIMAPAFVGFDNSDGGYLKSYLNSSDAVLAAYGTWLGNRYKNYDNIVWSLGGDADPSIHGLYDKIEHLASALASADPNHLMTLEACRSCRPQNQSSLNAYDDDPPSWLHLNWVYNTEPTVTAGCQKAYAASSRFLLPPLMGEDWYELEHSVDGAKARQEGYSEILSGCYLGRLFGNASIYSFNSPNHPGNPPWRSQLSSEGSVSQALMGKLMSSREHWKLVPDVEHIVVTSGYGSGTATTTAARTSDGQTIIAYIPNGSSTTLTVDMTKIDSQTNKAKSWWFNPRTGTSTQNGIYANSGSQTFIPPDSNDWVLVIDDAKANLVAPGTIPAAKAGPESKVHAH